MTIAWASECTGHERGSLAPRAFGFLATLSLKTKTFLGLVVFLLCFAALGIKSYSTLTATSTRLGEVYSDTLPKQTVLIGLSDDVTATHMKVFRFVTLASNGVTPKLLSSLYSDVVQDLKGYTIRFEGLRKHAALHSMEEQELELIRARWSAYVEGVRDLMDVGAADAAMAAMMLGATDEDFQAIAGHLSTISSQVNRQTKSVVSGIMASVDSGTVWLVSGGSVGMLICFLVAFGFVNSLIRPLQAVTSAMKQVSSRGNICGSRIR